jgi:site-specific recombinase XerD
MSNFHLRDGNTIYLHHWVSSTFPRIKISTKIKIDKDDWDPIKGRAKSEKTKFNGKSVNQELARHEKAFYDALNYFDFNSGFSLRNLKLKYTEVLNEGTIQRAKAKQLNFVEFFEQIYLEYKEKKINSYKSYGTTLTHLKLYLKNTKISFADIDMRFYKSFGNYLLNNGLSKNTISNHWKHIKAIMHEAQNQKLHSNTEYERFKRSREESDTIFLTEKELDAIYALDLKGTKAVVRDYFLLGCYTGLRYSDWDQLNRSIVKDGICTVRSSKTGELSTIPIHPRVSTILKKYKDGTLPKKLSIQKMNEYIKAIGLQAKITENIETRITKGGKVIKSTNQKYKLMSTHTARRTFASILVLNGVSPYLIMKITGHKSLSSFEKYVRIEDLHATVELKDLKFFK